MASSKRLAWWGVILTAAGLLIGGLSLYFDLWPVEESSKKEDRESVPTGVIPAIEVPPRDPLERTSPPEGLPVHHSVTTAFLAGKGWSFSGDAGDLVALTAVMNRRTVVQKLKLVAVEDTREGTSERKIADDCCPNLLEGEKVADGRAALFRLPHTGRYHLVSTLPSTQERVTLYAYSLAGSPAERYIRATGSWRGTMKYPGEVQLFGLRFQAGERRSFHVQLHEKIEADVKRVGLVRVLPDNRLTNITHLINEVWWELTSKGESVLALYHDDSETPLKYTITVRDLAPPTVLAEEGQVVPNGTLLFPGQSDLYRIKVGAGSTWEVTLKCEEPLTGMLDVEAPSAAVPKPGPCNPTCRVAVEAGSGGTMHIRVASSSGTPGTYNLSVLPASSPAQTPPPADPAARP